MLNIIFYTKENCSLCEDAFALLLMFQHDYPFVVEERDIHTNDAWLEEYQLLIPVVEMNGLQINCEEMGYDVLEKALKEHTKKS